jgi:hypothetical protein
LSFFEKQAKSMFVSVFVSFTTRLHDVEKVKKIYAAEKFETGEKIPV